MKRRDGGNKSGMRKIAHASNQPTSSAGSVKPQGSRIKDIEDQIKGMLKMMVMEFDPETQGGVDGTKGGVDGRLNNIEKMMTKLKTIVVKKD